MSRKYAAAIALAFWLFIITGMMILNQAFNMEIFFVLWLIGILFVLAVGSPAFSKPDYVRRIHYVVAVGVIAFGYIVAVKVLEILAS